MSFTKKDLSQMVHEIAESNGSIVIKNWLITGVFNRLSHEGQSDADVFCRTVAVTKACEEYFRNIKATDCDIDEQLIFDGFERLQKRYLITRDDEVCAIYSEDITDDEFLMQVVHRLESQIAGSQLHIEEIMRYLDERMEAKIV